jgi:hypothetical protein
MAGVLNLAVWRQVNRDFPAAVKLERIQARLATHLSIALLSSLAPATILGVRYGRVFYPNVCQFRVEVVDASDTHAYINDTIGMRVVRARLDWDREETCAIGE